MTPRPLLVDPCVPSAGGDAPAAAKPAALTELLSDGDEILLAFRPSVWFILIVSWPVLVTAAILLLAVLAAGTYLHFEAPRHVLAALCSAGAAMRLIIACFQWMGRLYVLTNRRVLRVRGLLRVDVFQCLLRQVRNTVVTATFIERVLGLGSLYFEVEAESSCAEGWINIARPAEIQEMVNQAVRRSR